MGESVQLETSRIMVPLLLLILSVLAQRSEQCAPVEPPPTPPPPPPPTPPPPQNCEWSEWSTWSGCSATCGGGKQAETRSIAIEAECGGDACTGDVSRVQDCNVDVCPSCDGSESS